MTTTQADSPPQGRFLSVRLPRILLLGVQLGVLWLIARGYQVENANFLRMLQLAFAAILLRAVLPDRFHWPLFSLASVAGLVWLLGPVAGGWILALGGGLLLLAHVRIAFAWKLVLLAIATATLALLRLRSDDAPWPSMIWPIFGSMFMFRYIVYLYDLRHRAARFGVWESLGYFFMLPNVCFPLFPVVDYKTFVRSWKGSWAGADIQAGLDALFRGLTQLLVYRLVYQHVMVEATSLQSASDAALYLVRPYLLYLKISGTFHVIVGILSAFGFALPRSNHNYFLASSFTDYWRRINIYWKDFLQKIIFNPAYFALNRRMSGTAALVLATIVAFFATWALHSYQWFWIRGSFPVVWQDIVFWSFMGLVVLSNMLLENRRGRSRSLKAARRSLRADLRLARNTIVTFILICSSWAIWSVRSVGELQAVLERFARPGARDLLNILGILLLLGALAVIYSRLEKSSDEHGPLMRFAHGLFFGRALAPWRITALGGALVGLAYGSILLDYPPRLASVTEGLRNPLRLSGRDAQAMDRGYYEDLTDVARFNPELAELFADRPPDWGRNWAAQRTGGFPTHVLQPARKVAFKRAELSTNSHGMRDKEYALAKPEGVFRIALHGASHSMGSGVEDDEVYEAVAEARWNAQSSQPIEILNFSVGGYGPLSRLADLESKILAFEPDAFVLVGINDISWGSDEFLGGALGEYRLPWPELEAMAQEWGIKPGMDEILAEARLNPHREELVTWIYCRVADICREHGIAPFLLALAQPREESGVRMDVFEKQLEIAEECGLVPLDMLGVFDDGSRYEELVLAKWDGHPNAAGHAMLAEEFLALLSTHIMHQP